MLQQQQQAEKPAVTRSVQPKAIQLSLPPPREESYKLYHQVLSSLARQAKDAGNDAEFRAELTSIFPRSTIIGQVLRKPYGYSGDFEIIDWLHTGRLTSDRAFVEWDAFIHSFTVPLAVRSRSKLLPELIRSERGSSRLNILNVASGPMRDILPILKDADLVRSIQRIENVDADKRAIEFAQSLLQENGFGTSSLIEFSHCNVFRLLSNEGKTRRRGAFNIVWSAGLFDYFDDTAFVKAMKILIDCCATGGVVMVGNISVESPERDIMDHMLDWKLHHRTDQQLLDLAVASGIPRSLAEVKHDITGINLFLQMRVMRPGM